MATSGPPLDEIVDARPDISNWWQSMGGQPMDENIIHRYFSETPFFEWESKNGLFFSQAKVDPNMWAVSNNRKALEEYLSTRAGLEYMIAEEPQPVADKQQAAAGVKTGVWVINKQDRRKAEDLTATRPPGVRLEGRWEITTLGTYYIVGHNVYQAPSVFDVIGNRLLSAATSLNKMIETMADLPRFSSATGYSYLPPTSRPNMTASVAGSPSRSREGSLAPGVETPSLRSGSAQPDSQIPPSTSISNEESRLLGNSLRLAILYDDEYTDENPLVGEPGNFRFTSSTTAVKKRRADEEAALAKARAAKEAASISRTVSPKADKVATPRAIAAFTTEVKQPGKDNDSKAERRASRAGDRIKRRKSKMGGAGPSPTTPGGTTAAPTPTSARTPTSAHLDHETRRDDVQDLQRPLSDFRQLRWV